MVVIKDWGQGRMFLKGINFQRSPRDLMHSTVKRDNIIIVKLSIRLDLNCFITDKK